MHTNNCCIFISDSYYKNMAYLKRDDKPKETKLTDANTATAT
jgi:hypothetical protein